MICFKCVLLEKLPVLSCLIYSVWFVLDNTFKNWNIDRIAKRGLNFDAKNVNMIRLRKFSIKFITKNLIIYKA